MSEIPLDGWCVQVFHLADEVDVDILISAIHSAVPAATCTEGDGVTSWLAVETLDEEPLVEAVRATVTAFDPGAAPQVVSRPKVDPLLAG